MFEAVNVLESTMRDLGEEGLSGVELGSVQGFTNRGRVIASWLHDYGHKRMNPPRDQVMPYYREGGEWLRMAPAVLVELGAKRALIDSLPPASPHVPVEDRAALILREWVHQRERYGMTKDGIEYTLQFEDPSARANDQEAWDLGQRAAEMFLDPYPNTPDSNNPSREWLAGLPADPEERLANAHHFVDLTLDPMGFANGVWATSSVAEDPDRYSVFAASYRAAILKAVTVGDTI